MLLDSTERGNAGGISIRSLRGSWHRLWPLSRDAFPKQFHQIAGGETLFQQACSRLQGEPFEQLSILANHRHRFLIADQLGKIGVHPRRIVLEPVNRNTAPAAAIASLIAFHSDPDSLIVHVPSDHMIPDKSAFARAVDLGIVAAKEGALVTFGIEPNCLIAAMAISRPKRAIPPTSRSSVL